MSERHSVLCLPGASFEKKKKHTGGFYLRLKNNGKYYSFIHSTGIIIFRKMLPAQPSSLRALCLMLLPFAASQKGGGRLTFQLLPNTLVDRYGARFV